MEGPRSLRPEEFASLCELVNTVFRSGVAGRMEAQYPLLFDTNNHEHLLVMTDRGRVVSHVGTLTRNLSILGRTVQSISIGAVATYEAYRGQGLATRLMETAIRKGKDEGSILMLISGGRGLYRRLGSVRAGRYAGFEVKRSMFPETACDVAPATDDDMPVLTRLYAHEPVRYERSLEDFITVMRAGWVCDRSSETLVIRRDDRIVAYAGVQRPRPALPEERAPARIMEIAGARSAAVQALPAIMARYGTTDAEVITLDADAELGHLMRERAVHPTPVGFMGTIIVLLPDRLIEIFSDYIRAVVGAETADRLRWTVTEETVIAEYGEETAAFNRGAFAQLCFGVVEPETDPRLAVPEGSRLRDIFEAVFPLPLPWYGYNFV